MDSPTERNAMNAKVSDQREVISEIQTNDIKCDFPDGRVIHVSFRLDGIVATFENKGVTTTIALSNAAADMFSDMIVWGRIQSALLKPEERINQDGN
jgi:hypothetical protein